LVAASTDRRNTGIESLCRRLKLQGLAWPFVELSRHFVQMGLRVVEYSSLGLLEETQLQIFVKYVFTMWDESLQTPRYDEAATSIIVAGRAGADSAALRRVEVCATTRAIGQRRMR